MNRPIDKALFMLLLETKARKEEIRKLKIKDEMEYSRISQEDLIFECNKFEASPLTT